MEISRRGVLAGAGRVLTAAATAAAASALGGRTVRANAPASWADARLPIIDTHQHVWDLQRPELCPPWMKTAPDMMRRRSMAQEYLAAVEGLHIERSVYVEIAQAEPLRPAEAAAVVEMIRQKRGGAMVAAIIGGDPGAEGFADYVRAWKDARPVKGVRTFYRPKHHTDEKFAAGLRLLGELGMSFDLVAAPDLLLGAAGVVAACPGTLFVMDHCGNADPAWFAPGADAGGAGAKEKREAWKKGVAALAAQKNVVCKISGVAEAAKGGEARQERLSPIVNFCLDQFGEDRVMWASNWPVCLKGITIAGWVWAVRQILSQGGAEVGSPAERKLFYGNAAKWYRLGEG